MKVTKTATFYAITIGNTAMERLLLAESYENPKRISSGDHLMEVLGEVRGVDEIEYNGHFGPHVYLRIDSEFDNYATHKRTLAVIRQHLAKCGNHV